MKATKKPKKKEEWPRIKKVLKNGRTQFLVDARIKRRDEITKKDVYSGERKFCDTKAEAEGFQQIQRIQREASGIESYHNEELKSFGWSIPKAIEFALENLRRTKEPKPLDEAIEALKEFKKPMVGETRMADLKQRLGRFQKFMEPKHPNGINIGDISPDDINDFLGVFTHPVTRNDHRRDLVALWNFARAKPRCWVSGSLDKNDVPRIKEPDNSRAFLTIEQTKKLLEASVAEHEQIVVLNALILFGGCRREEVVRLKWSDINLESGYIEISAEASKVHTERFAPILPNLRAWLEPIVKGKTQSEPIITIPLRYALNRVWKAAGIDWVSDMHRHSFISYRRRQIGDAQTALDAGTSERIIKRNYKRPTTVEQAKEFFEIFPAGKPEPKPKKKPQPKKKTAKK